MEFRQCMHELPLDAWSGRAQLRGMDSGRKQFSPNPTAVKGQITGNEPSSKQRSRLLGGILFVLLVGGVFAFFREQRTASELRQENESLRAMTNELGRLRAENEEVTRLRTENQDMERLRKDNEDLYRLRNEVAQLRKEKLEWTKDRGNTEKSRALGASQSQTTLLPPTGTPTNPPASAASPLADRTPRPWLGFYYVRIPSTLNADGSNTNERIGTLVSLVRSNSPAGKAGLQVGDIVVKLNDQPVKAVEELDAVLRTVSIGQFVNLEVIRQESPIRIQIQVEDRNQND